MRLAAACLGLSLSGCSFVFVHGPPPGHQQLRYFDCVSSSAAPVADGSWAVAEGVMAATLASPDEGERSQGGAVAFFASLAALHTASAIYGVVHASSCSDAKQHLQQRLADQDLAHARLLDELRRGATAQPRASTASSGTPSPPLPSPYVEAAPAPASPPPASPAPAPPPASRAPAPTPPALPGAAPAPLPSPYEGAKPAPLPSPYVGAPSAPVPASSPPSAPAK